VLTFHLRVALGSNAELQTQLALAARVGILAAPAAAVLDSQTKEVGRMLQGLLKSIQRNS
jgi:four helix bundle protein